MMLLFVHFRFEVTVRKGSGEALKKELEEELKDFVL